jgi:hypothetical protein
MFGGDKRDLCVTLIQMYKVALERAHFSQTEAKEILRCYLQTDRRFDPFDPDRVIERTQEARSNGRTMDLLDGPYLRRGGEKRPPSW